MKLRILLLAGALSFLSACSDGGSPSDTGQSLDGAGLAGPVWELTRYTGSDGLLRDVLSVTTFQFRLAPGSSGADSFDQCTRQGGTYAVGDESVTLRFDGPVDGVVCEPFGDPAFDEQRLAVRTILDGRPPGEEGEIGAPLVYRIDGDTLELSAPDGRQLVFMQVDAFDDELPGGSSEAAALLLSRTWTWDGYRASFDAEIEAVDDAPGAYTLRFSADGSVGGEVSCNAWSGDWTGPGVSLDITRVVATEVDCGGEARESADRYLDALRSAFGLSVLTDEPQLFVFAPDGVWLRFSPARDRDIG